MLARRDLAAEHHRDDQVAQIFVEHRRMRVEQHLRAASRQQRVMEFEVVALPGVRRGAVAVEHPRLDQRQLVVRRHDAAFPFHVAGRERVLERVAFQELAQVRHFLEVLDRGRRHLEAARALGDDEPFRGQTVEDLAQRADADAIGLLQTIEFEPLRRFELAADDVAANPAISLLASRFPNTPMIVSPHPSPDDRT